MDCEEEQRKIYQSAPEKYTWLQNNQYHKLVSGFVHDQNAKVKLSIQNNNSVFKIQQKLTNKGKTYQANGTFHSWNLIPNNNEQQSFSSKLNKQQSVTFGACQNSLKLQWRMGEKLYKRFYFNPFIGLQTPKDLHDLGITMGLNHRSQNLNLLTKLTAFIINYDESIFRAKLQYAKNQMFLGLNTEISQKLNCKISKSLLGYEFSVRDYFYLRFQTDSINRIFKGKQVDQQLGFYYLRKMNQNLKFALGLQSVNSIDNTLNLIVETKLPYNLKAKIDTRLNTCVTVRKDINETLSVMYGIGVSDLFKKKSRVQTGLVVEYNA